MQKIIEIPKGKVFDEENSKIVFKDVESPEEIFLSLWEGCVIVRKEEWPNSKFWEKDGKTFFELENSTLWCDYDNVWSKISKHFGYDNNKTEAFIKELMEKHFKMIGVTPFASLWRQKFVMEKHFKMI